MRLVESLETDTAPRQMRRSREEGLGPALSAIARAVGESGGGATHGGISFDSGSVAARRLTPT